MSLQSIWLQVKAWCKDNDWWYLAVAGAALLAVCLLWSLWLLVFTLIGIGVVVALAEYIAVKSVDLSLSDDFRVWREKHLTKSRVVLTLIVMVVVLLVYHFAQKPNL